MSQHDSVITAQCFTQRNVPWCYGYIILTVCGMITLIFGIWCLYRMFKYQNEAKLAVRSFTIYSSIILSVFTILDFLFVDGLSMSLTESFLVSVQCSLFTVFFTKICIRTYSDTLPRSMEYNFQAMFLVIMISIECIFFIWSLVTFNENEVDCHSLPYLLFSCVVVMQILCTIIAVWLIGRKLKKEHQNIGLTGVALRSANEDIKLSMLQNQKPDQINMLTKSRQLLLLLIFIFICAIVSSVWETWNFLTIKDCTTYVQNDILNEILSVLHQITWLFMPSWLLIYIFWLWPIRPKYVIN
eukprot:310666_1